MTCSQSHNSVDWVPDHDARGTVAVRVAFVKNARRACPSRPLCARAKTASREMMFRRPGRHEAIRAARKRQDTPEWRTLHRPRGAHRERRPKAVCRRPSGSAGRAAHVTSAPPAMRWTTSRVCLGVPHSLRRVRSTPRRGVARQRRDRSGRPETGPGRHADAPWVGLPRRPTPAGHSEATLPRE